MMRNSLIITVLMIAGAFGLFYGFTEPRYRLAQELELRHEALDEALERARQLEDERNRLVSKRNTMSEDDLDKLSKMLPDTVDSVRLVLDIDTRARENAIELGSFAFEPLEEENDQEGNEQTKSAELSFIAQGSYGNFVTFLQELEQSLRLLDIQTIELDQAESAPITSDTRSLPYEYGVTVRTHWLP